MGRKPSKEEIEARAYEIYVQRGGEPGRELEDWVIAEKELSEPVSQAKSEPERDPRNVIRPNPLRSQRATASGSDRS
ncbi:MAG TPA: DUF2934 domain-containing protein [Candidatus Limnocylindrales bacterium]|nr:DUF2934 domain-containing protein [Candidatus Limnocylindrales bacterium]